MFALQSLSYYDYTNKSLVGRRAVLQYLANRTYDKNDIKHVDEVFSHYTKIVGDIYQVCIS